MRLDRLHVKNFRCFTEHEWLFNPNFNVLIGDNGTGKSSVLEALRIAIGAFFLGIDGIPAPGIGTGDVRYEIDLNTDRPYENVYYPVRIEADGVIGNRNVNWYRERYGKKRNTTYGGAAEINRYAAELQKKSRIGDRSVIFPLLAFYGPGRLFRRLQDRSLRRIEPKEVTYAYRAALSAESDFDFQLSWWRTRILANNGRIVGTPLLDATYKSVLAILGNDWKEIRYDLDFGDILVLTPNREWHPVTSLSDGQRSVLAMALDMSYMCVILNPSLGSDASGQTEGIVLIDEIELHLHPIWQREIVGNLRRTFPNIQFIVTSHSPLVIQSLDPGELIDLGPKVDNEPEKYVGKSPEDIYEHVMDVPVPQRSEASLRRYETAMEYYRLLREAETNRKPRLQEIKHRLDELMIPYYENEAYAAYISFLKEERIASGIDRR